MAQKVQSGNYSIGFLPQDGVDIQSAMEKLTRLAVDSPEFRPHLEAAGLKFIQSPNFERSMKLVAASDEKAEIESSGFYASLWADPITRAVIESCGLIIC